MTYATDGKCHNAEPGTYGHECGKPAIWIGTTSSGFASGYCDLCKAYGSEAKPIRIWHKLSAEEMTLSEAEATIKAHANRVEHKFTFARAAS